ncbi:MAG: hypothetical protein Q4D31_07455 [Eubacteriales bacterium]|nr:hypothetical protein [Eubacteriales bacterium]
MKLFKRKAPEPAAGAEDKPKPARRSRRDDKRLPSKTTMNLYIKRKTMMHPTRLVPMLLAIVLAAAALGKLGVADRLARVEAERIELAVLQGQLAQVQAHIADLDEVKRTYNRYSYAGIDRTLQDRLEVLDLIEQEVFPYCTVRQLSVTGRMLTLTIADLTLGSSSELVGRLEAHPDMVEQVFVSASAFDKADGNSGDEQIIQMSVLLRNAEEELPQEQTEGSAS